MGLFLEVISISKSILTAKTEGRTLPYYLSLLSSLSWTWNVSIMKTNHSFIRNLGYLRLQDHLLKYRLWEKVKEIDRSYFSNYNTDWIQNIAIKWIWQKLTLCQKNLEQKMSSFDNQGKQSYLFSSNKYVWNTWCL